MVCGSFPADWVRSAVEHGYGHRGFRRLVVAKDRLFFCRASQGAEISILAQASQQKAQIITLSQASRP